METKAEVQAVVLDYLQRKNLSINELARRVGLSTGTLTRMLRDDPKYRGKPENWATLARFPDFHLSEADVLAAVGLGPRLRVVEAAGADPWVMLEKAMSLFNLPDEARSHIRGQMQWILDGAEFRRLERSNESQ